MPFCSIQCNWILFIDSEIDSNGAEDKMHTLPYDNNLLATKRLEG